MLRTQLLLCLPLALFACTAAPSEGGSQGADAPAFLANFDRVDDLIQEGEEHFVRLWQLTHGGENAEGYWSQAGDALVLQRRAGDYTCDRIFHIGPDGQLEQVSSGKGVTTCAYFMNGDSQVIFASTQAGMETCPPPADYSEGYVWSLHPEYDLWVQDLETGVEHRLTETPLYDAEATVSPLGDRIVFTSMRSGDLELWTCDLDGSNLFQVTDKVGYDGGAFFSNDGQRLIFRSTIFTPDGEVGDRPQYLELLAQNKIRPHTLEIMVIDADGTNRRQVTELGGANFAPFFYPDDSRVIFSTNHHDEGGRNFDLFSTDLEGEDVERVTHYEGFDSFPQFSPDGRWLVFASNRGGTQAGETNLFVAEWR